MQILCILNNNIFEKYQSIIESPLGNVVLTASDKGLRSLELESRQSVYDTDQSNVHTEAAAEQLREYFDGSRIEFDLTYDFEGYSDFFISIWRELIKVKYGETKSYLDLAKAINNPKSVRAVGMANGKNPIGIIVPCHRIIGSDGSLTGYAGGLEMKRWLLEKEGAIQPNNQMTLF